MLDTFQKAALAARFADEKKAEHISLLDLRGLCNFTDAFMICTGNNRIQLHAISDAIQDGFRKVGHKAPKQDSERDANWMVLDYGDVVIHIMSPESRSFYRLEKLWGDATELDWEKVLEESEELEEASSQ